MLWILLCAFKWTVYNLSILDVVLFLSESLCNDTIAIFLFWMNAFFKVFIPVFRMSVPKQKVVFILGTTGMPHSWRVLKFMKRCWKNKVVRGTSKEIRWRDRQCRHHADVRCCSDSNSKGMRNSQKDLLFRLWWTNNYTLLVCRWPRRRLMESRIIYWAFWNPMRPLQFVTIEIKLFKWYPLWWSQRIGFVNLNT